MRSGDDDSARVIGRAHGEIEHIGRDAADIHDIHARVYQAGGERSFQLRRRFARVHAHHHCLRSKEIRVRFRDAIVRFFVEVIRIDAANVVGAKDVPVHEC